MAEADEAQEVRLEAELARLREENDRLREEYARARQAAHRRAAIGLAGVGTVAIAAGVLFPPERPILLTIGAIGVFAAILTAYLTPERFVAATVGERIYAQLATTLEALVELLDLSEHRVYVPRERDDVCLFVPQHGRYELPEPADLTDPLVLPPDDRARGLVIRPTGDALVRELLTDGIGADEMTVVAAANTLAEALVETFELVDVVSPDLDVTNGRASFAVTGSVYGSVDRIDHPIVSTLASGLARTIGEPVEVTVTDADERADHVVVCRWETA